MIRAILIASLVVLASLAVSSDAAAQSTSDDLTAPTEIFQTLNEKAGSFVASPAKSPATALQMILMLALASLAPAIVLACTCFARFVIVFSFVRSGLATQGAPPSQVLVGLALFMTLFVMSPVASKIYDDAARPYLDGEISEKQAFELGIPPLRDFLLERTRSEDLQLFYGVSGADRPATPDEVPMRIAVPAFVLSELGLAFKMGLIILLPFLVIDLVVASVLSALGMVMLPPPVVSLPIKLLVFVSIDGWHLLVSSLLQGVA